MSELRNRVSQEEMKQRLMNDPTPRTTISFYKYHPIAEPREFRDELFRNFRDLGAFGRIYVAHEGINAQMSVPTANFEKLKAYLESFDFMKGMRINMPTEDDGKSFWILKVKVREKIVADGIDDPDFSVQNTGAYLKAKEFNELTDDPETVVVDMRNYYEYEVGHFENALEVPSDTFREQLPKAIEMLADQRDKNIVMYCTGGIRCEKASAYLMHHGFMKVYHLEGGILKYVNEVREQGLENKFRGKNYVFDGRRAERVGEEIISHCHQCGELADTHQNCANDDCHLLFIQCAACAAKYDDCCSEWCQTWLKMAPEEKEGKKFERDVAFNNSEIRRRARFFDVREK